MLNNYEKKLYEHWKTLDWDSYYKESLNYDFNTFSEEFNNLIRDNILNKAFENIEEDDTPYEEVIEKWFNSLSKEDKKAFLNEDWSELKMLTKKEYKILESLSNLKFKNLSEKIDEIYDNSFSEELKRSINDLIGKKYFEEFPDTDETPYEETLEKWFNNLSTEDQIEFLNEDWSELND